MSTTYRKRMGGLAERWDAPIPLPDFAQAAGANPARGLHLVRLRLGLLADIRDELTGAAQARPDGRLLASEQRLADRIGREKEFLEGFEQTLRAQLEQP